MKNFTYDVWTRTPLRHYDFDLPPGRVSISTLVQMPLVIETPVLKDEVGEWCRDMLVGDWWVGYMRLMARSNWMTAVDGRPLQAEIRVGYIEFARPEDEVLFRLRWQGERLSPLET